MTALKEFFNLRILLNCILFALPVAVLCLWRMVYVMHLPFLSAEAAEAYVCFVLAIFIALRLLLFVMYLLGSREEKK